MDATTPQDTRVQRVVERLQDELVDSDGRPADTEVVAAAVTSAAEELNDAPVQEFMPLLVEHQALEELREQGLHRDLEGVDDDGSLPPASDDVGN
jgi:hypothetical protein